MNLLPDVLLILIKNFAKEHESKFDRQCFKFLSERSYLPKTWFEYIWKCNDFRVNKKRNKKINLKLHMKWMERDLMHLKSTRDKEN